MTGITVATNTAWQTNFNIFNDNLMQFHNQASAWGQFIPSVCIQKTYSLTGDQVNVLYGNVLKAMHTKWVVFWIWLVFGVLVVVIGAYLTLTYRGRAAHKDQ